MEVALWAHGPFQLAALYASDLHAETLKMRAFSPNAIDFTRSREDETLTRRI